MRRLGLIGGMSWESTAIYYRRLNEMARERLGGLHSAELVLWSVDFAEIEALQARGDWVEAGRHLAAAARGLAAAGAQGLVICTNTMHVVANAVIEAAGLPLIHIADATAHAVKATGATRPLLLATRYTMEQDFYAGRLRDGHGLDVRVPDAAGRTTIHDVIYHELCQGVVRAESRARYRDVIATETERQGVDAVVFGCTEVGMLISRRDTELPVVDSTEVHCASALAWALDDGT